MKINLSKIQTLVINLKRDAEKREHVSNQLKNLNMNFKFVDGVACNPGIIGCGLSHIKALKQIRTNLPAIIFEDDVKICSSFQKEIDVPDDVDAIYLGRSRFGLVNLNDCKAMLDTTRFFMQNDDYFRIERMLSTHGVLYVSKKYVDLAIETIIEKLTENICFDIGMAAIQEKGVVLTPKKLFCYQSKLYRGQQEATDFTVEHYFNIIKNNQQKLKLNLKTEIEIR